MSLLAGISEYCETATRLKRRTFGEAVDGYLNSVATIKRMDIGQAVEQFIEERKLKTVAREGKRPQLSPEHHYNTSLWLREFGKSFPGNAVSDLTKAHLDAYMQKQRSLHPRPETSGAAW